MDNKRLHLEMLQAVINRMAANSFLLKGWSVTLISALFALSAAQADAAFVYLAYFPAVGFWILDGYFLRQEKLFRELYDEVRTLADNQIDFSMNTSPVSERVRSWPKAMLSNTLHGMVLVSIVVVAVVTALAS